MRRCSAVLVLVLGFALSTTFAACGDDDANDEGGGAGIGGGGTGAIGGSGATGGTGGVGGTGGDGGSGGTVGTTLCDFVSCGDDEDVTCDPADGLCKCGGPGGILCSFGQSCELEPSPTCVSDACAEVVCSGGNACDPTDGICKCGGIPCGPEGICDEGVCTIVEPDLCEGVTCPSNTVCNREDGACYCGDLDGPRCNAFQSCVPDGDGFVCSDNT